MAIGDVTQKKLMLKILNTTANSNIISGEATKIKTITSITLQNSNVASRVVTIYLDDYAIIRVPLDVNASEILTGLDYIITGAGSFTAKQDEGTDVIIAVMGVEEVVSV